MKKLLIIPAFLLSAFILSGCQLSSSSVKKDVDFNLREYNQVYVLPISEIGVMATRLDNDPLAVIEGMLSSPQSIQLHEQTKAALNRFRLELDKIGFKLVDNYQQADGFISFYISRPRKDAFNRWIADEANIKFVSKKDKQVLLDLESTARFFIPIFFEPSVNSHVGDLVAKIKRHY